MNTTELNTKILIGLSLSIKDKNYVESLAEKIHTLLLDFQSTAPELFTKFITAPASTKFHGAYDGGLFEHSLNVCANLLEWKSKHPEAKLTDNDCIIIGFLHDLCKADLYYKDDKGKYKCNSELYSFHGIGSVNLIENILKIKLTRKQKVLILLHMSGWENDNDIKALTVLDKLWLANINNIKLLQAVNWADMKDTVNEVKLS